MTPSRIQMRLPSTAQRPQIEHNSDRLRQYKIKIIAFVIIFTRMQCEENQLFNEFGFCCGVNSLTSL